MKVLAKTGAPSTLLVKAAAALAGAAVQVEEVKSIKKGVAPHDRLPVALGEGGEVVAHSAHAIARLIADTAPGLVGGEDVFARAEVDQWLGFALDSLEHLRVVTTDPKYKDVAAEAAKELLEQLAVLEQRLQTRTFLVGKSLTLADVSVAASLVPALCEQIEPAVRKSKLVNVTRWFETVRQQAGFADASGAPLALFAGAGKASAATKKTAGKAGKAATATAVAAAAAGSSAVDIQTLFQRSRSRVKDILHREDSGKGLVGQVVKVCGWARTIREAAKGKMAFVELSDGSCFEGLQVVCKREETAGFEELLASGGTGSSHSFVGEVVASKGKGQAVEVMASEVTVLGTIDERYPLKKTGSDQKGHSMEFLRDHAHLRARTHMVGAVARVRNACAYAVHQFFHERGFLYVHTPLITASDCEGAGEMFAVTTLLGEAAKNKGQLPVVTAQAAKERAGEEHPPKEGDVDYKQDFFGKPSFLTVSGQLNVETYACALSDVYTFGPTFRAENSNTSRHLAEFWMIEPELCFATLKDDMDLAEDFLKYIAQYVLQTCSSDVAFFDERVEEGLVERLKNVIENPFKRLTYTDAVAMLNEPEHLAAGNFNEKPYWGIDLGAEHEQYLAGQVFKKPVILTDYPADIKAFYMKQNELDSEGRLTVQAMDILVPRIGELMGGSAREENLDKLEKRITDMKLEPEEFAWYCDLRRFGTVPHAGFGMGFERLVMFVTGVRNIRDVIPFPRYPKTCNF